MLKGVVYRHCCISNTDIAPFYIVNVISDRFVVGIVIGTVIR